MRFFLYLLSLLICCSPVFTQDYLTPLDFGLHQADHGRIDYQHTPPNILCGKFNNDCYPDIARFTGNKLEVFIFLGNGYSAQPQGMKSYLQPIKSLALTGACWTTYKDLTVTLADGTTDTLRHRGVCLDLQENAGFLPDLPKQIVPPRFVNDFDFQQVWQSDSHPYGMNKVAVGDLDNDGINELVTWWKQGEMADSAWILIYKSTGDNQYQLSVEAPFTILSADRPAVTFIMLADLDQNGQKELICTADRVYLWEFSAPGVYTVWHSNFTFTRGVEDMTVSDVDRDGVLELAMLTTSPDLPPPTCYMVQEHSYKGGNNTWVFTNLASLWQDWVDYQFAVGDFDNDGATDMVAGNFGGVWGYSPIDIQYYRFNPTMPNHFTLEWLHTGIPLSCTNPQIADFDGDSLNELYAPGLFTHGGSAFIWNPTGQGTGRVAWMDTTTMIGGPNMSAFGYVDGYPSVMSEVLYSWPGYTLLYLFSAADTSSYAFRWEGQTTDCTLCANSSFLDMDQDGKMNFVAGTFGWGSYPHFVLDWEQSSAGIPEEKPYMLPSEFRFQSLFPNPFNSQVTITFDLARSAEVKLDIYNLKGQRIHEGAKTLFFPGTHCIPWNSGKLASGLYYFRLSTENAIQIKKGILLK